MRSAGLVLFAIGRWTQLHKKVLFFFVAIKLPYRVSIDQQVWWSLFFSDFWAYVRTLPLPSLDRPPVAEALSGKITRKGMIKVEWQIKPLLLGSAGYTGKCKAQELPWASGNTDRD